MKTPDYMAAYRGTRQTNAAPVRKFEIGGAAPGAPAPGGDPNAGAPAAPGMDPGAAGGDPMGQISGMVQQWMQTQDPQLAMQIVQMLAQLMGGGQPAPEQQGAPAPEQGAPMAQNGMRVFKKGGSFQRR